MNWFYLDERVTFNNYHDRLLLNDSHYNFLNIKNFCHYNVMILEFFIDNELDMSRAISAYITDCADLFFINLGDICIPFEPSNLKALTNFSLINYTYIYNI